MENGPRPAQRQKGRKKKKKGHQSWDRESRAGGMRMRAHGSCASALLGSSARVWRKDGVGCQGGVVRGGNLAPRPLTLHLTLGTCRSCSKAYMQTCRRAVVQSRLRSPPLSALWSHFFLLSPAPLPVPDAGVAGGWWIWPGAGGKVHGEEYFGTQRMSRGVVGTLLALGRCRVLSRLFQG